MYDRETPHAPSPHEAVGKPHILVVEDDKSLLETMVVILEMAGYRVSHTRFGRMAARIIKEAADNAEHVDILVADVVLPDISGIALLNHLNKLGLAIPSVVATGYRTKSMTVELLRLGVSEYLDKPFEMTDLVKHVRQVVSRKTRKYDMHSARDAEPAGLSQQRMAVSQEYEILGKLARGVIHDFNNMLGSIAGYADMILEEADSADNAAGNIRRHAAQILQATEIAEKTIHSFHAFTKKNKDDFEWLDINEVVRESLELANGTISKSMHIHTMLTEGLPKIKGIRPLLHNAFINLFLNARDAVAESGHLYLHTEMADLSGPDSDNESGIVVTVQDNGSGIPEYLQRRVFEPFFTTKKDSGNGLGLSGVLRTIEDHGGRIELFSQRNVGTEFRLVFPDGGDRDLGNVSQKCDQLANVKPLTGSCA